MVVDLRKKQIAKIIAKSWVDDDFRVALIADPVGVITGFGVRLTEGMTLEILQDTDQLVFIVLPAPPSARCGGVPMSWTKGAAAATLSGDLRMLRGRAFVPGESAMAWRLRAGARSVDEARASMAEGWLKS